MLYLVLNIDDIMITEAYSEPCQISKMELFTKVVNSFHPLTIFAKRCVLDVRQGGEYAFE